MAVVSIVITGMTMNMLIAAIDLSAGSICALTAAIAAKSMSYNNRGNAFDRPAGIVLGPGPQATTTLLLVCGDIPPFV